MESPSREFSYKKFLQHYRDNSNLIKEPTKTLQREFGFLTFNERIMIRHKHFQDLKGLKEFLQSEIPAAAYHSSAYYEHPAADEMNQKGWIGADLVFDIDADHIPTPCSKIHDSWLCTNCEFEGKGLTPKKCPSCGKARFEEKKWTCERCLESAKKEAVKLVEMLITDFSFQDNEVKIYFSGNRGYHVHVESEAVYLLNSMERKEVVDYIIGLGLDVEFHRLIEGSRVLAMPSVKGGWRSRIGSGLLDLLAEATFNELQHAGLSKSSIAFLDGNRGNLIKHLKGRGWVDVRGVGDKNWRKLLHYIADKEAVKVDTVVTTDVHRLIRLAGSLHEKTGFMKTEVLHSHIDDFDPFKEAVAFKEGHVTVDISEAPEFRVEDSYYGPFKNASHVELPTAAALLLVRKKAAKVVA